MTRTTYTTTRKTTVDRHDAPIPADPQPRGASVTLLDDGAARLELVAPLECALALVARYAELSAQDARRRPARRASR